jgi:hypothetical protein
VISLPKDPEGGAASDQFLESSFADEAAAVEEKDFIGMFDGREPVGNENLGHLASEIPHGHLDPIF